MAHPTPSYSGRDRSTRSSERRTDKPDAPDTTLSVGRVASIDCVLRRQPGALIEVPRGLQLQVTYGNENDAPNSVHVRAAVGGHATGRVKSGSDWVLVRNDGVIIVDARVTIQFTSKILMDMTLKGTIDLKETFHTKSGQDAYEKYKTGTADPYLQEGGVFYHRFVGSARFEGGDGPVDSDYNDDFKAAPFVRGTGLDQLVREQFFATGKISIQKVPHYDPTRISLDVWSCQD
jgi:hypothetical protein